MKKLFVAALVAAFSLPLAGCVVSVAAIQAATVAACGILPSVEEIAEKQLSIDTSQFQTANQWASYICSVAAITTPLGGKYGHAQRHGVKFKWVVVDPAKWNAWKAAH